MKIRVTESVGEVFRTIEVENPTDKVIDIFLGTPMVAKEDEKTFVENLMSGGKYAEPKSIIFDQTNYGSRMSVECNYDSYKWAKDEGYKELVYIKITNGDSSESVVLTLDQADTLHKYLGEVINFMES